MSWGIVGIGALSALLISGSLLAMYWEAITQAIADFQREKPYMGDLNASIVALAGGRIADDTDEEDGDVDPLAYRKGIASEAHDYLGLSKGRYQIALIRMAALVGVFIAMVIVATTLSMIGAVILGTLGALMTFTVMILLMDDAVKVRKIQQVRQFPFFLDIFLLIVQSNGNVDDAITAYRSIFGEDELAQELLILQEDTKSLSMDESFDRLRNRIGNAELRNILGEMTHKLRTGTDLQPTLEQLANDMRNLREELGAQAAERLNAKFQFPVVFAGLATLMIFLAPAIAQMKESGFL